MILDALRLKYRLKRSKTSRSKASKEKELEKIFEIEEQINKVCNKLKKKFDEMPGDVITKRNHPEIRKIWKRLQRLHTKAMLVCEYDISRKKELADACKRLSKPRPPIEALHLSGESTSQKFE